MGDHQDEYSSWVLNQSGTISTMISYQLGFKGRLVYRYIQIVPQHYLDVYLAKQSLQLNEAKYALNWWS
ncbi:hypothetical protein AB8Q19_02185 [Candidatus Profftella armatura]